MSKSIPFYPNQRDNAHCAPAVFKSLIEYFCDEKLSWDEIDKLGRSIEGKGTWTTSFHLKLARCGVQVLIIESFDYQRFAKDGKQYLETLGERGRFYINNSNWQNASHSVEEFLQLVHHKNRNASIDEMDEFLEQGYLLGVELNSRVLNNRDGFMLHYVLIKEKQADNYLVNDPGGANDSFENRLIAKEALIKAIGGKDAQYEVAAFRKFAV